MHERLTGSLRLSSCSQGGRLFTNDSDVHDCGREVLINVSTLMTDLVQQLPCATCDLYSVLCTYISV